MFAASRLTEAFFRGGAARANSVGRGVHHGFLISAACALWLGGAGVAYGGPCTEQIARLEAQIKRMPPGLQTGPTFSQTLGAQLHQQPTPRDVEHAESVAKEATQVALESAKKADAAGNADECHASLTKARQLYGLD